MLIERTHFKNSSYLQIALNLFRSESAKRKTKTKSTYTQKVKRENEKSKLTSHYFALATETAHQTEKLIFFVIQTASVRAAAEGRFVLRAE